MKITAWRKRQNGNGGVASKRKIKNKNNGGGGNGVALAASSGSVSSPQKSEKQTNIFYLQICCCAFGCLPVAYNTIQPCTTFSGLSTPFCLAFNGLVGKGSSSTRPAVLPPSLPLCAPCLQLCLPRRVFLPPTSFVLPTCYFTCNTYSFLLPFAKLFGRRRISLGMRTCPLHCLFAPAHHRHNIGIAFCQEEDNSWEALCCFLTGSAACCSC